MSDETILLPCPFCGSEVQIIGGADSGWAVYCPECNEGGHTEVGWYFTKADATDAWNTRYDPIDDARIVEVETSHIDIKQGEIITRFVPEQAATEQVEELKTRLTLAAADSMGGVAFAALAVDELTQAIAATIGGTLTAEQVKEAIERYSSWVVGTINCFYFNDGTYEAIADELNATMGGESASELVDRARNMARDIQGNLGRNLYSQKDAGTLQETSAMLMELANELDNTRF